jgi:hypothetical protein
MAAGVITTMLVGLMLPSATQAAPTGLNLMPTADLLAAEEAVSEFEVDGARLFDSECSQWALLQVGVSDRVEVGVDRCFDGEKDTFGNAKLLLAREGRGPAVALGVQNVAPGAQAQPYLSLAKDVGRARLHLGAIRLDGRVEAMAGIERGIGDRLTLLLDHVTGDGAATGVGLSVNVAPGLSLTAARIFVHIGDEDDSWQFLLSGAPALHF